MITLKFSGDSAAHSSNNGSQDAVRNSGAESHNRISHLFGSKIEGQASIRGRDTAFHFLNPTPTRPADALRNITVELRRELSDFIEKGMAMPASIIGFLSDSSEPLDMTDIKESLYNKSRTLEALFTADSDQSAEGISMRSLAQGLQGAIDSFRVYLTRQGFSGEIPRSSESGVIEATIEFKQDVSQIIQKIDAFTLQRSIANHDSNTDTD